MGLQSAKGEKAEEGGEAGEIPKEGEDTWAALTTRARSYRSLKSPTRLEDEEEQEEEKAKEKEEKNPRRR